MNSTLKTSNLMLLIGLTLHLLIGVACSSQNTDTTQIVQLTPKEAKKVLLDSTVTILDIRTVPEYKAGHLTNAVLIPVQELQQRISEINHLKKTPVLVYCRTGNRSKKALQILQENGFTNLLHLEKGIKSWIEAGYKVE